MIMVCRQLLLIFYVFLSIGLPETHSTASNSLSDCQVVASAFRSTINYTATNITGTTGVNVSCSTSGVVCPGVTISGVCVWQRKLSAVCRSAGGIIRIRIQTNNLPPRCASVPMGAFVELNVDFEVNFNPDVSINSLNQNLNTLSALSQYMCTLTYPSSVPSAAGFVNYGTNVDTATGVSVDGVLIFSPDSMNNIDPFYPPPGGTAETVDACLAHCQAFGVYHYHIATGCMVNPPSGSISSCAGTASCNGIVANYSIASFSSYQTRTVIGVVKDGHVIYGPYLSSGTRVTTGFDVCNGMFYDSIGNYAYFATSTYPYMVGCFGPGNYPSFGPNCTTNGASSYSMSSYALSFLSNSSNSTTAASSSSMPPNSSLTMSPGSSSSMPPNSSLTMSPGSSSSMPPNSSLTMSPGSSSSMPPNSSLTMSPGSSSSMPPNSSLTMSPGSSSSMPPNSSLTMSPGSSSSMPPNSSLTMSPGSSSSMPPNSSLTMSPGSSSSMPPNSSLTMSPGSSSSMPPNSSLTMSPGSSSSMPPNSSLTMSPGSSSSMPPNSSLTMSPGSSSSMPPNSSLTMSPGSSSPMSPGSSSSIPLSSSSPMSPGSSMASGSTSSMVSNSSSIVVAAALSPTALASAHSSSVRLCFINILLLFSIIIWST